MPLARSNGSIYCCVSEARHDAAAYVIYDSCDSNRENSAQISPNPMCSPQSTAFMPRLSFRSGSAPRASRN